MIAFCAFLAVVLVVLGVVAFIWTGHRFSAVLGVADDQATALKTLTDRQAVKDAYDDALRNFVLANELGDADKRRAALGQLLAIPGPRGPQGSSGRPGSSGSTTPRTSPTTTTRPPTTSTTTCAIARLSGLGCVTVPTR